MAAISVKEAVKVAKDALLDLYEDDLPMEMALEEVEKTQEDGREFWAVTLGFYRRKSVSIKGSALGGLFTPTTSHVENRVYKTLFVDAETGEFVKMDIRQVQ
jgi:hypothetical protein